MKTITLKGLEEIPDLLRGVEEDFRDIDWIPYLQKELLELSNTATGMFASSQTPDGVPWKPNAPRTIREKGHARILRGKPANKYRLSRSLTQKAGGGDAIREAIQTASGAVLGFGTAVEYALYNDQGTNRIPARPHIGINEKHLDGMVERVADYAVAQLAKM